MLPRLKLKTFSYLSTCSHGFLPLRDVCSLAVPWPSHWKTESEGSHFNGRIPLYHSALPQSKGGYWGSCGADNLRILDECLTETVEEQSLFLEPQQSSDGNTHIIYLGSLISSEILNWCWLRSFVRAFLFKAPERVTFICQHITSGRAVISSIRSQLLLGLLLS